MKYDDFLALEEEKNKRKRPSDEEHQIQCACIRWFRMEYPELHGALIAVPNGGRRDKRTGYMLKMEGVIAGVSDLILMVPDDRGRLLLIELKTSAGRQSDGQIRWQRLMESLGHWYVVVRSVDQFIEVVRLHLKKCKEHV